MALSTPTWDYHRIMDDDYFESATEVTLQHICAAKVVSHILERHKRGYKIFKRNALRFLATEDIKKLSLPTLLKDVLVSYVVPILYELARWYDGSRFHPQQMKLDFTWRGNLDVVRMTKKVVEDERQTSFSRNILACTYCHEMHIPRLNALMGDNYVEAVSMSTNMDITFSRIWRKQLDEYYRNVETIDLKEMLDYWFLHKLVRTAINGSNGEIALIYLEKSEIDVASKVVVSLIRHMPKFLSSPLKLRRLFVKLSPVLTKPFVSQMSEYVLRSHLHWPYQGAFLGVAQSLIGHFSGEHYMAVLQSILKKIRTRKNDFNYTNLLYCFWKLGVERDIDFFQRDDSGVLFLHKFDAQRIVKHVYYVLCVEGNYGHLKDTFTNCYIKTLMYSIVDNYDDIYLDDQTSSESDADYRQTCLTSANCYAFNDPVKEQGKGVKRKEME